MKPKVNAWVCTFGKNRKTPGSTGDTRGWKPPGRFVTAIRTPRSDDLRIQASRDSANDRYLVRSIEDITSLLIFTGESMSVISEPTTLRDQQWKQDI